MNKFTLTFSAVAVLASAFASAADSPLPQWNHANDSGEITVLREVQYSGVKPAVKNDDRIKFVAPENAVSDNGYVPLRGQGQR